eukprot:c41089_g1_i1 orf=34-234(+)
MYVAIVSSFDKSLCFQKVQKLSLSGSMPPFFISSNSFKHESASPWCKYLDFKAFHVTASLPGKLFL